MTIFDIPDVSRFPNNIILNVEPVSKYVRELYMAEDKFYQIGIEIEDVVRDTLLCVCMSYTAEDTLYELLSNYSFTFTNLFEGFDRTELSRILHQFIIAVGTYLIVLFKSLMLYAIDDIAYYTLSAVIGTTTFVLAKNTEEGFLDELGM